MKYTMLDSEVVERICKAFYEHSEFINDKYNGFAKGNKISYSDRDRFVKKFFDRYIGKYIVLVDKELIGYVGDLFAYVSDHQSVYSSKTKLDTCSIIGKPLYRSVKKYLRVSRFSAMNERYGSGYIEMVCGDIYGAVFYMRLDGNNLHRMQFREITEEEFNGIADLFVDDREDVPFKVTRFLTYEEIKKKHLTRSKTLPQETVSVLAKDAEEAMGKVSNAIAVTQG